MPKLIVFIAGFIGGVIGFALITIGVIVRFIVSVATGIALIGLFITGVGVMRDGWHPHAALSIGLTRCAAVAGFGLTILIVGHWLAELWRGPPVALPPVSFVAERRSLAPWLLAIGGIWALRHRD